MLRKEWSHYRERGQLARPHCVTTTPEVRSPDIKD